MFELIRVGNLDNVKAFIRSHIVPLSFVDERGNSMLHWAAYQGQFHVVKHFVERGCDVNASKQRSAEFLLRFSENTSDQRTPLHMASVSGHLDIVYYLINAGESLSPVR